MHEISKKRLKKVWPLFLAPPALRASTAVLGKEKQDETQPNSANVLYDRVQRPAD